jgi:iron complex outermembrane receptor protein
MKITLRISLILLIACSSMEYAFAQTVLSGKVTDETGNPVAGVNIVEKGTGNGTMTNGDGMYTLTYSNVNAVIIFSFVGHQTQEVSPAGRAVLDVTLVEDISMLGEIQIVGSRNSNRSITETPVPVDVIDASNLANTMGKIDITQILQYAAPSFNATKQSGSDGADHVDPASLRGLGPDQTLVLINGKRRHQSSLVNIFGTRGRGNSGTDLNAIPASAIKRIEILRDGASAQYGSDAIAGVINIVLKDAKDGFTGGITYGAFSTAVGSGWEAKTGETLWNVEGKNRLDGKDKSFDGNTMKIDMNYGLPIGDNGGYLNFTTEFLSKDRTLRPGFSWRQGYGSAAMDGFNFMVNSSIPINPTTEFYIFGGSNLRHTDAYAFSRGSYADDSLRTVPSLYPNGFSPHITSDIRDVSASAGIRHQMSSGWKVDFSNTFGKNNFHYYITGTNNASIGAASPTDFDAGGHSLTMNVTNMDFSKLYKNIASGLNLAFGMEFRAERFAIFAGEVGSYALYDTNGIAITNPSVQTPATTPGGDPFEAGSQGFPGYSPDNEVDRGRTNFGLYGDVELNVTDAFLINGALRFEKYSDFGETFNFKLATRYSINDNFSLRGSASSGFRAPSLAQIHYNLKFSNIVGGESLPSLLASNTSTVARAFGIGALQEETAFNASVGFTFNTGGFTATVDAYSINVDDRIVLTDNFDASGLGLGVEAAQFFANGVDTKTTGIDIVLSYNHSFSSDNKLSVALSGNFNKLEIDKFHNAALNEYTFFGPFSRAYLKAAAPDYKIGVNVGYTFSKFTANIFLTQFSKVIINDYQWVAYAGLYTNAAEAANVDTDEDAIGDTNLFATAKDTYDPAMTVDLSLSYQATPKLNFTIGGNNIFNKYATPQFDTWTDQGGMTDSVQMGSDGAYFFGRVGFKF